MHELSIVMGILDIAAEEAQRHDNARVVAIHVKLGALSGVVKDALLSAFELARELCGMPDCLLLIEEVPVVILCPKCREPRGTVSIQESACCECGTPSSHAISGRELEVSAMEFL